MRADSAQREVLESFAHELVVCLINRDLHAPQSQLVQENLQQIVWHLRELFAMGFESPLRLDFSAEQIHVQGEPLVGPSLQAGRLLTLAREREVRELAFHRELGKEELHRFMDLFASDSERNAFRPDMMQAALGANGIRHLGVTLHRADAGEDAAGAPTEKAIADYQALANVLQEHHVAAFKGEILELDRAEGVVEQALQQMGSTPSRLLALASYDDIDSFTVGHSVRVALLAMQVASATGADKGQLMRVGTAALLHDIGKSRIPQEILFKQGKLDEEEWAVMTQHSRLGAEILLEQGQIDPAAIGAAFCHHMAPDGKGYPTPALAFEPSGISKLVRVCDVFEALTSVRPYKRALTPAEAYVLMHRDDKGFAPEWLAFFEQVIGVYPLGTRLLLDDGSDAVVEDHGPSIDQPIVRLLTDPDGKPLTADAPELITIGAEHDGVVRRVEEIASARRREQEADPELAGRIVAPQHACSGPGHSHDHD